MENRETFVHEEAVAEIGPGNRRQRRGREIEVAQCAFTPPIHDVDENRPVTRSRVYGLQEVEVRRELNQARFIRRRESEIPDDPIGRVRRVDGIVDSTGKALVRTRQPVGFALGYRIARLDLDANNFRDGG